MFGLESFATPAGIHGTMGLLVLLSRPGVIG